MRWFRPIILVQLSSRPFSLSFNGAYRSIDSAGLSAPFHDDPKVYTLSRGGGGGYWDYSPEYSPEWGYYETLRYVR
jgi:hypothetical protein